jgi:XTP/dITP diphosphohydrolase
MSSGSTRTRLLVATTNAGKVREIGRTLAGLPFEVVSLAEVLPKASYRERGRTFLDNARGKGLRYARLSGLLTLAEDSGLEVDALGGAPGVHSARFARPEPTDERNLRKVLRLLRDVPRPKRRARFVCAMVLAGPDGILAEVLGEVRGVIAETPKGSNGFGYDPIFHYPRLAKRFAELSPEAKNDISHRGRALAKMAKVLKRLAAKA